MIALATAWEFAQNRWAQLLVAIVLCLSVGYCEGKKAADKTAELKRQNDEIARLQAEVRVAEWARKTTAAISLRVDEASQQEVESRREAEEETRAATLEADEWERKFLEQRELADAALRTAADAASKVNAGAGKPAAVACPRYDYSAAELDRMQRRLKAIGRSRSPSKPPRHPTGG